MQRMAHLYNEVVSSYELCIPYTHANWQICLVVGAGALVKSAALLVPQGTVLIYLIRLLRRYQQDLAHHPLPQSEMHSYNTFLSLLLLPQPQSLPASCEHLPKSLHTAFVSGFTFERSHGKKTVKGENSV